MGCPRGGRPFLLTPPKTFLYMYREMKENEKLAVRNLFKDGDILPH